MGGNGLNSPEMVKAGGPGAVGVAVGAAWFIESSPLNKSFVARYKAKYNSLPDQFAAQSYAAAQVIAQLVREGASTPPSSHGLKNVKVVPTVLGPIGFEASRDVKGEPVILKIVKNGFAYF